MKKIFLLVVMMTMMTLGIYAEGPAKVPAYRGLIERVQPNGYTLRTYLRGDEHHHWMMTEDGWQIKETKKGWYKYAKITRKGEVKTSWRKARNIEDRTRAQKRWLDKHGVQKDI